MARILILDDDKVTCLLMQRTLEEAGHAVQVASNGNEGMKVLDRQPADLIVCDVYMPDMDGLQVIRALRRRSGHVKILAVSAGMVNGLVDLLPTAALLGANWILYKPFSPEILANVVAGLLGQEFESA